MAGGRIAGARVLVTFLGALCLMVVTVSCTSDTPDSRGGRAGPDHTTEGPSNGPSEPKLDQSEPTTRETGSDQGAPSTGPESGIIPQEYVDLLQKAAEQESVRVIVTMRLESTPSHHKAFRRAIANAADGLFSELSEFDVQQKHVYRNLPIVAAEVDEPALRHLVRSDRVLRVSEDKLEKPAEAGS